MREIYLQRMDKNVIKVNWVSGAWPFVAVVAVSGGGLCFTFWEAGGTLVALRGFLRLMFF